MPSERFTAEVVIRSRRFSHLAILRFFLALAYLAVEVAFNPAGAPALTASAQVVEQLGGVSYVYAVGKDGETKVTIQQKGHSRIAGGAAIAVGFEPGALLAFDQSGLRI